jgi:hypothetical protein
VEASSSVAAPIVAVVVAPMLAVVLLLARVALGARWNRRAGPDVRWVGLWGSWAETLLPRRVAGQGQSCVTGVWSRQKPDSSYRGHLKVANNGALAGKESETPELDKIR